MNGAFSRSAVNTDKADYYLNKHKKKKKSLLFAGLILIALSIATSVLLFSLRYEELWGWYADIRDALMRLENWIASLDKNWQFFGAVMVLYIVKSVIPIYFTSTVCFLTGIVLPMYWAIPVNILGFIVQITIKYFWGKKFGAGYAWKMLQKNDTLRHAIQFNGKGNPALLLALRLVPGTPVNTISAIYGSFDFGYRKFLLLSVGGFLPKIISFTIVGKNMFDPLSAGFLLPIIIISFLTGVCCLGANGVWSAVEIVVKWINEKDNKKAAAKEKSANRKEEKDND